MNFGPYEKPHFAAEVDSQWNTINLTLGLKTFLYTHLNTQLFLMTQK